MALEEALLFDARSNAATENDNRNRLSHTSRSYRVRDVSTAPTYMFLSPMARHAENKEGSGHTTRLYSDTRVVFRFQRYEKSLKIAMDLSQIFYRA